MHRPLVPRAAVCPECRQGKCPNCTTDTLNADEIMVVCACLNGGHSTVYMDHVLTAPADDS